MKGKGGFMETIDTKAVQIVAPPRTPSKARLLLWLKF